ncbi:DUF3617 domain-containing protein [Halopseudomonas sabulinigri]|uniref:DUF3617 domain-containing protein n=1 Tax=Halopseudomonas sabulinigri TaxID=472181 RepID=A0ABP9ZPC4_9GAMM
MTLHPSHRITSLLLIATPPLFAASIEPAPEPGLWHSESTTLINGVDLQAKMREARQAMLANMPAEQRAMVEEMMGSAEDAGHQRCISAELAEKMTDPEALLADAREQMPGCELKVKQSDDDRLEFSGDCANTDGFTGTMQGDMQMISSREIKSNFRGDGTYQLPEQAAGGLADKLNGPVKVDHQEISKWVASDCGDVPVE